jgi:hypothetical protein
MMDDAPGAQVTWINPYFPLVISPHEIWQASKPLVSLTSGIKTWQTKEWINKPIGPVQMSVQRAIIRTWLASVQRSCNHEI